MRAPGCCGLPFEQQLASSWPVFLVLPLVTPVVLRDEVLDHACQSHACEPLLLLLLLLLPFSNFRITVQSSLLIYELGNHSLLKA